MKTKRLLLSSAALAVAAAVAVPVLAEPATRPADGDIDQMTPAELRERRLAAAQRLRQLGEQMRQYAELDLRNPFPRASFPPALDRVEPVEATYLGVGTRPATSEERAAAELDDGFGLVVTEVAGDSPAARSDLRVGDLLVLLDGQRLANLQQLAALVRSYEPGDAVAIEYFRDGDYGLAEIELGEAMVAPLAMLGDRRGIGMPPRTPLPPLRFDLREAPPVELERLFRDLDGPLEFDGFDELFREGVAPGQTRRVAVTVAGTGSAEYTMDDDEERVVIRDVNGVIIYEGGVPMPEEIEAMPKDVRHLYDRLREAAGLGDATDGDLLAL